MQPGEPTDEVGREDERKMYSDLKKFALGFSKKHYGIAYDTTGAKLGSDDLLPEEAEFLKKVGSIPPGRLLQLFVQDPLTLNIQPGTGENGAILQAVTPRFEIKLPTAEELELIGRSVRVPDDLVNQVGEPSLVGNYISFIKNFFQQPTITDGLGETVEQHKGVRNPYRQSLNFLADAIDISSGATGFDRPFGGMFMDFMKNNRLTENKQSLVTTPLIALIGIAEKHRGSIWAEKLLTIAGECLPVLNKKDAIRKHKVQISNQMLVSGAPEVIARLQTELAQLGPMPSTTERLPICTKAARDVIGVFT